MRDNQLWPALDYFGVDELMTGNPLFGVRWGSLSHPTACHQHAGYAFYHCISGAGELILDGQPYTVQGGDVVVFDGTMPHTFRYFQWTARQIIHFRPEWLPLSASEEIAGLLRILNQRGLVAFHVNTSASCELEELGQKIIREQLSQRYGYVAYCAAMLEQTLILLAREMKEAEQPNSRGKLRHPIVVQVQEYIDDHFATDLNISQISETFHVNRSYLSTLFKRNTGMTLIDYIHHKRVAVAAELLADTSDPVWKIAQEVGFADVTYFARIFRRHTGTLPHVARAGGPEPSA